MPADLSDSRGTMPGMGEAEARVRCELQVSARPKDDRYPSHYVEYAFPATPPVERVKRYVAEVRDQWFELYGDTQPMVDELDVATALVRVAK